LSSPDNISVEISPEKAQCTENYERPAQVPVPVVDAQNSPILCLTSRSVGCSPVELPTSPAAASHGDTQLVETVDCSVQTSAHVVDGSCSPLPRVVTCSVGCSPLAVNTKTATTSPIPFVPAVGCSMQTEPWMIDAECSPVTPPRCEGYCMASAQTSLQDCSTKSTKYSTASFSADRPQSQRTADSASPGLRQDNLLPDCGEDFCRKRSVVGSESSYATPSAAACSCDNEDPPCPVVAADALESFEISTQPHSSEELFDDNSQLSYTSPSSVAHQPHSIYPSQLPLPLESGHETPNSNTQAVELEDHAAGNLLNLDDFYSLESSQVFPKCSDEEETEEVKSNHAEDETYQAAV